MQRPTIYRLQVQELYLKASIVSWDPMKDIIIRRVREKDMEDDREKDDSEFTL